MTLPVAPVVTDLAAWRAQAKAGTAPSAHLRKAVKVTAVKQVGDEGKRQLAWIISTANPDRENDVIAADGWEWDNWVSAGAPILWAHNSYFPPYNVPIASGSQPTLVEGNKLRSVADFGEPGIYPFADMVYELARPRDGKPGRLRAASVGFMPLEWSYDEERDGYNFLRQEGLEWSIVPIPANAEAVQESRSLAAYAKSLGQDTPLREFAEAVLDGFEPGGVWLPKAHAAEILKAVRTSASVSVPGTRSATQTITVKVEVPEETQRTLDALGKSGRTFSSANETRIRDAHGACVKATAHLQECIDQCAADDADDKSAAPVAPAVSVTEKTEAAVAPTRAESPSPFVLYPVPAAAVAAA